MKKTILLQCLAFAILLTNFAMQLNAAVYTFQANDKTYQIVDQKMTYASAAQYAVQRGGYLVHIESSTEQASVFDILKTKVSASYTVVQDGGGIAYVWIGASDLNTEGTWIWDGNNDGNGVNFWIGEGTNTSGTGYSVDSRYQNWGGNLSSGSPKEPDNYGTGQDAAAFALATWPDAPPQYKIGDAGEWNDISATNQLYFVVEYDVSSTPSIPTKPTGTVELCQGSDNTIYSTTATNNALTYSWQLIPSTAGSVNSAALDGIVSWNSTFFGTAKLIVKGVNPLGESNYSDTLDIEVLAGVEKAATPTGKQIVCNDELTSNYSTEVLSNATTYYWEMLPNYAGTIEANQNTAVVTWATSFTGEVTLTVYGENNCGQGAKSEKLTMIVNDVPGAPAIPTGEVEIEYGTAETSYTANEVENASNYNWILNPAKAGTIEENSNTVVVKWDSDFAGDVTLSVNAENVCGKSEDSEILEIEVKGAVISVSDNFEFINAKIYPNPSISEINIELGDDFYGGTIEISDVLGNMLIQSEVKSNLQTISVNDLPAGKYFVKLTYNGQIYTDTFIKQ